MQGQATHKNHQNGCCLSAQGGLNLFEPIQKRFIHYRHDPNDPQSLQNDRVYCLLDKGNGEIWLGTEGGLQLFNPMGKGSFKPFSLVANTLKNPEKLSVRIIKSFNTDNLLLGTNDNGLILFNPQFNSIKHFQHHQTQRQSLASDLVRSILVGQNGQVWVGGVNGGLSLFDPVLGQFFQYQNNLKDAKSLSQRTVSAIYEDNQGNLWVGTHRGGINLHTPNLEKFRLFQHDGTPNSLSHNDVKAFCEDRNGIIWIGTDGGGLNRFDPKTNTFQHFKYNPFDPKSLGSNEILDIYEDHIGNLWIATWGGGLNVRRKGSNDFERFLHNQKGPLSISSNYIEKIFEDSQNRLWIASYFDGLNVFDRATKTFTRLREGKNQTQISGNNTISINEDAKGNMWFGTDDGGLNCLNKQSQTVEHYFNDDEKKPDLRILFNDSKGRLWAGQAGLYLFDAKAKKFNLFTDKGGLATAFIKGIVEDSQHNFWITTSNGLLFFNPETLDFKKYNTADGLQGLEFEAKAVLKTKNGHIYLGGINGFNIFNPSEIALNTYKPPVFITDLYIFNEKITPQNGKGLLEKDISQTETLTLTYEQSTFSLAFAALNFTGSENNRYLYKLENWDKNWNEANAEKRASYVKVSAGTYVFHVKAANNDGIWNETGKTLTIVITPPFWETWWFRLLVLSLITASVVYYFWVKKNSDIQKLEARKEAELYQVQLQFFTNISHEFRTPLSLILGPIEKLLKEDKLSPHSPLYKTIYRNAQRLTRLISELMDFRKAELGALKLHVMQGNIHVFLTEIAEGFSEIAKEKDINLVVLENITDLNLWFDRQILEKIVLNLMGNAFKYTASGGTITVEVLNSLADFKPNFENELKINENTEGVQMLYLRVADTGIGISKEAISHLFERYYRISDTDLGSGIGLAFVKSLTLLHKGTIKVYSERHKGTEIIVGLPCSAADFTDDEKWRNIKEQGVRLESVDIHLADYKPQIIDNDKISAVQLHLPTLLLVDDNDELRHFLKDHLKQYYHISEASNGYEGMEKAKETMPDMVISDIMMPELNGIDFCKMLKSDLETSHIPFILLTAKNAEAAKLEGLEAGADYYFSKPLSIEQLELTLKNIVTQKSRLKEKLKEKQFSEASNLIQSSKDKAFLQELIQLIETHLDNQDMSIDFLCLQVGMSRTKLYNKVKGLTGLPIGDFIRNIRLNKAAYYLVHEDMSITEAMYRVGIQTQSYFTKAFKQEFGKTPTQFLNDLKK